MSATIKTILIDKDETSRAIIKGYMSESPVFDVVGEFVDYNSGAEFAENIGQALLFIDVFADFEKAINVIKHLKEKNKYLYIVAISNKTTTDNIIKILRAGAKEFLTKPIMQSEFITLLDEIKNGFDDLDSQNSCKIISTFSNKGGIGKTSIAVNLALEIAQMTKEKVALVDLNLQLGDVSTFLDLSPTFSMDYIADNINNLAEEELLKATTRYKNTSLYVIADPLNIDKSNDVKAVQIETMLNALKRTFSYVVIDVGTNIDSKTISALNYSDLILLIAIVNLPAIRSTQRCMELFKRLGYNNDKIKLILNRYMESDDIKASDIEEVVNQKVYWKIPNNYLTMVSAINKGVPVSEVNSEANISLNYKDFANKITDYLITKDLNKGLYN